MEINRDYVRGPYQRPFDFFVFDSGKNNLIGAEVGVYKGLHAKEMLDRLDITTFILIDPWKDYEEYTDEPKKNKVADAYFHARELLKPYSQRLVWMPSFSENASRVIANNSLDFVYIDGNHEYEWVKTDLKCWYPKVKKGGYFGGHDYTAEFPGVIQAVDEFCEERKLELKTMDGETFPYYTHNTDWIIKK
jgi:hypothetical protein